MKILVLVDGSMWGQKAAMHAVKLAKRKDGEITLLSVLDIREAKAMAFNFCMQSGMCEEIKNHEEKIWRDMKKSLNLAMADLVSHLSSENVVCTPRIVEGNTREEIVREVETGGYGLVVMGAYGKNAKSRVGSLPGDIAGEIPVPLLIVH